MQYVGILKLHISSLSSCVVDGCTTHNAQHTTLGNRFYSQAHLLTHRLAADGLALSQQARANSTAVVHELLLHTLAASKRLRELTLQK